MAKNAGGQATAAGFAPVLVSQLARSSRVALFSPVSRLPRNSGIADRRFLRCRPASCAGKDADGARLLKRNGYHGSRDALPQLGDFPVDRLECIGGCLGLLRLRLLLFRCLILHQSAFRCPAFLEQLGQLLLLFAVGNSISGGRGEGSALKLRPRRRSLLRWAFSSTSAKKATSNRSPSW